MIGRLNGTLLEKKPPFLLLEVGGLAYEVQASMNTFYRLPELGSTVILHTHLQVREDAQLLFGFWDLQERELFRTLLKVNGIGARTALAILSSIDPIQFVHCVMEQNSGALQRLPGVGKKTAERLIIEMRDRLNDWPIYNINVTATPTATKTQSKTAEQDAISALIALGYKPQEASRAVLQVNIGNLSSEELIRLSLKSMNA